MKSGLEVSQEQIHKINITLYSKHVQNLKKDYANKLFNKCRGWHVYQMQGLRIFLSLNINHVQVSQQCCMSQSKPLDRGI